MWKMSALRRAFFHIETMEHLHLEPGKEVRNPVAGGKHRLRSELARLAPIAHDALCACMYPSSGPAMNHLASPPMRPMACASGLRIGSA